MLLLRVCPGIPFILLNYMLGITHLRLRDYILGNFAMLPGLAIRVFFGTTLSELTQENLTNLQSLVTDSDNLPLFISLAVIGLVVGCAGVTYIVLITKRYIRHVE
jgi:uncharacterized membrane protein YdjX (TVP38/TMEM64 family)